MLYRAGEKHNSTRVDDGECAENNGRDETERAYRIGEGGEETLPCVVTPHLDSVLHVLIAILIGREKEKNENESKKQVRRY